MYELIVNFESEPHKTIQLKQHIALKFKKSTPC